jgi:hypothetical protein
MTGPFGALGFFCYGRSKNQMENLFFLFHHGLGWIDTWVRIAGNM